MTKWKPGGNPGIPWSWHFCVLVLMSLEQVAISCRVAMHVPFEVYRKKGIKNKKTKNRVSKALRHCIFLNISTEDQLPYRTKRNTAFYVTKLCIYFFLSLFLFFFWLVCAIFPLSFFVTAQVPGKIALCKKNSVFIMIWIFIVFVYLST